MSNKFVIIAYNIILKLYYTLYYTNNYKLYWLYYNLLLIYNSVIC